MNRVVSFRRHSTPERLLSENLFAWVHVMCQHSDDVETDVFLTTSLHKIHRTNRWFYDIYHANPMPVFYPPIKDTQQYKYYSLSCSPLLAAFLNFVFALYLGFPLMVTRYHLA
jgi:hypothetical protein